eukprot:1103451-Alexandrium_andersonii.AAC.1
MKVACRCWKRPGANKCAVCRVCERARAAASGSRKAECPQWPALMSWISATRADARLGVPPPARQAVDGRARDAGRRHGAASGRRADAQLRDGRGG